MLTSIAIRRMQRTARIGTGCYRKYVDLHCDTQKVVTNSSAVCTQHHVQATDTSTALTGLTTRLDTSK
jgi:hypothetical protein